MRTTLAGVESEDARRAAIRSMVEFAGGTAVAMACLVVLELRNPQFRAYADYMESVEFREAVDDLVKGRRIAVAV